VNDSQNFEIHVYDIQRCGKGMARGEPCNRKAVAVHVRADHSPPLVLWLCRTHHAEAVDDSKPRNSGAPVKACIHGVLIGTPCEACDRMVFGPGGGKAS